jgi:biopolymer transport protein ExbD
MRFAGVMLALATGCFAATPVMHFGAGKSPEEAQHETLSKLMPPQLVAEREWRGEVRSLKIRVWADDEYRSQNVQWQHTFQEELEYANSVLAAMLGIRFDAEYRVWQRHAPGATLSEDLAALAHQDPGDGVFSVVGLTSALGLASATFDQIGYASNPGRYLVLRGYADVWEREAFDRSFPKIGKEEREDVLEARRQHKTTAVLLHELGHNLGAPHEDDPDTIMSPIYSDHSASFSVTSRSIMRATLDARLGRPSESSEGRAASAPQDAPKHPWVIVGLTAAGDATIGGQPVDPGTLDELFRRTITDDPETEVVVRIAPHVPQDAIVKLVDRAKKAGFKRVSISASAAP